jgi:hypothetical protein
LYCLSFFFWPLYCLSFFFWALYCLSFFLLAIVLSIFLLLGIVLSISLRLTASDNHFGILNTFLIYSGFQCKKDMSTSFSFPLIRTFYFDFPRFCPSIMVY